MQEPSRPFHKKFAISAIAGISIMCLATLFSIIAIFYNRLSSNDILLITIIIFTIGISGIIAMFRLIRPLYDSLIFNNEELELVVNKQTKTLQESEERTRRLIENAPDAIIGINKQSEILLWNKKAEETFGWRKKEIIGMQLSSTIIPQKYREAHHKGLKRFLESGKENVLNRSIQISALHKTGFEFHVSLSISQVSETDEIQFVAFLRDISIEKETEEALKSAKNELERSNKELEQFAAVASHDLQEPLRTINSFLEVIGINLKEKLSGENAEMFEYVKDGSRRMKSLIQNLLEYSRISKSKKKLVLVDLNSAIQIVKANLKTVLIESGTELIIENHMPTLLCDETQIIQLFQNLISNAIKFQNKNLPKIEVKSKELPDVFEICVKDNGIGMEPRFTKQIFEVFKRLNSKNEYPGTGLGLSICKKIVERHGGQIWAESQPEKGTTFYFTLKKNQDG